MSNVIFDFLKRYVSQECQPFPTHNTPLSPKQDINSGAITLFRYYIGLYWLGLLYCFSARIIEKYVLFLSVLHKEFTFSDLAVSKTVTRII